MDDIKDKQSIDSGAKTRESGEPPAASRRKIGSTLRDLLAELRAQRAGSECDEAGSRPPMRRGRR
jgi:hypothetical protein